MEELLTEEEIQKILEIPQDNELKRILHDAELLNATIVEAGANEADIENISFVKEKLLSDKTKKLFKKSVTDFTNIVKQKDGNVEFDGKLLVNKRVDSHGDLFTEKSIDLAQDSLTKNGRTGLVDVGHDNIFSPQRAFIKAISKNEKGDLVVKIKTTDTELAKDIISGRKTQLSVAGFAKIQEVKKEDNIRKMLEKVSDMIAKAFNLEKEKEELSMSEINTILEKIAEVQENLDSKIEVLTKSINQIKEDQEKTDKKVEKAEEKADATEEKTETQDDKFNQLNEVLTKQNEKLENLTKAIVSLEKQKDTSEFDDQDKVGRDSFWKNSQFVKKG